MTHLTRFLYVLLSYFMCCYFSLNSFMGYYGGFCGLFYFSFALIWLFTNSLAFQFKNSSFTIIQLFDFLDFLWYFPTLIPWQQLKYLCFKLFWIASCSLTECFMRFNFDCTMITMNCSFLWVNRCPNANWMVWLSVWLWMLKT